MRSAGKEGQWEKMMGWGGERLNEVESWSEDLCVCWNHGIEQCSLEHLRISLSELTLNNTCQS